MKLKRSNGIEGMKAGKAPANLKREKVTDRDPYSKPSPKAKMGGRAKRSKG